MIAMLPAREVSRAAVGAVRANACGMVAVIAVGRDDEGRGALGVRGLGPGGVVGGGAALLRVASPFLGAQAVLVTSLAGLAWSAGFATFALHYGSFLIGVAPRREDTGGRADRKIPTPRG